MKCNFCEIDFPLLSQASTGKNTKCGKCYLRQPGLSSSEIGFLNSKLQCAACGLVAGSMQHALCKPCIVVYQNNDASIPSFILKLPEMANILLGGDTRSKSASSSMGLSDDASAIMLSAARFQGKASETRLTKPTTSGLENSKYGNSVSKARGIKLDRQKKREEFRNKDTAIRVAATLWSLDDNHKMTQINPIRVTCVVGSTTNETSKNAMSEVLKKIGSLFQDQCPQAQLLTWSNVRIYAHENQSKFSSLDPPNDMETIHDYYVKQFVTPGLTSEAMQKDRKIEIRFAFRAMEIFPDDYSEFASGLKSSRQSALQSKRKRGAGGPLAGTSLQSSMASASTASASTFRVLKSAFSGSMGPPPVPAKFSQRLSSLDTTNDRSSILALADRDERRILKSAFIPPRLSASATIWTRTCEMITIRFTRTTATYRAQDGLLVKFSTSPQNTIQTIQIPKEHESADDVGFIGKGYTKRGIYARFEGREYVLTQPTDETMSGIAIRSVLWAEYGLLCIGNAFKKEFDNFAQEHNVTTIPNFYFNFEASVLGTLHENSFGSLRFRQFIATPLLPCGTVDAPIRKFTGNGQLGEANDHMTMAIHAFAHFSVVYSQESIVFCDLQGALDKNSVMCLIDPQAHTIRDDSLQPADNNVFEYWDRGRRGIQEFMQQHSEGCQKNWICRKLGLDKVVIQPRSPDKAKGAASFSAFSGSPEAGRASKKLKVSYLLADDDSN